MTKKDRQFCWGKQ